MGLALGSFFIPILGFILYLLFGHNLRRKHLFQWEDRKKIGIEKLLKFQLKDLKSRQFQFNNRATVDNKDLIYMLVMNNHAVFTEDNSVEILTDGRDKFKRLMKDISNAKITFTFNTIFIKVMNWEKNCAMP